MTKIKDLFGAAEAAPLQKHSQIEFFSSLLVCRGRRNSTDPERRPFDFAHGTLYPAPLRMTASTDVFTTRVW
jgi:hypothetical protein